MENNVEQNQINFMVKEEINFFMQASQYVFTALSIEKELGEAIKKSGKTAKDFIEEHSQTNPDIALLNNFNEMIEACKVYCKKFTPSQVCDILEITDWGDFLRMFFTQGNAQLFETQALDTKNNELVLMNFFYEGDKCYMYTIGRPLTEEEVARLQQN